MPSEQQQQDFYQKLREKVDNWLKSRSGMVSKVGSYILVAPDLFHLLMKMMLDDRIDAKSKTMIGSGILYFIAPIDFIPEFLTGPAGFMDDVVVAVFIVNAILNKFSVDIVKEHWAGDEDLLEVIRRLTHSGSDLAAKVPAGRLAKRFIKL
ncbi:DUF1232 domain-containing protein [Planococcus salinus]|uniref:DUF1232 domain-containing protein n=2 Tax=Planococcus salinus TaxID=1848460 RepID=A0A3M8PAN8_9BACL|nr:DUF1232 domain-containing protein [Planococcus salinus]